MPEVQHELASFNPPRVTLVITDVLVVDLRVIRGRFSQAQLGRIICAALNATPIFSVIINPKRYKYHETALVRDCK